MTILSYQVSTAGLASVKPQMVFINTDDTYSEIIASGYLNKFMNENSFSVSVPCMMNVGFLDGSGHAVQSTFNLKMSGTNYILDPSGTPAFGSAVAAGTGSGQAGNASGCNAQYVVPVTIPSGTLYLPVFTTN